MKNKLWIIAMCITNFAYAQNQIATIECYNTFAESGYNRLIITKDSTTYYNERYGENPGSFCVNTITPIDLWQALNANFNLHYFENIQSGKPRGEVDGPDYQIFITMASNKTYSIINWHNDENYQKLQAFFSLIDKEEKRVIDKKKPCSPKKRK